jgi:hypothetical protein
MSSGFTIHSKISILHNYTIGTALLITLFLFVFTSNDIYSILGIGITIYIALRLIIMMDYTIPIIETMLLIAASQWIIGPYIDYQTATTHYKMHMYVSEEEYMKITIPLFYAFTFSSLVFRNFAIINIDQLKTILNKNKFIPIYIIGISFLFRLAGPILPSSLNFVLFLAVNSSLVGVGLYLLVDTSLKNKLFISIIAISPIIFHAINSGMFHVLIIWGLFIFIFTNLSFKFNLYQKISILLVSILLLTTLQFVKGSYREIIYDKSFKGNKTELFFELLFSSENSSELQEDKSINDVNIRLNQGWIISKIYERIPEKVPFLGGETIMDAIEATLLPRFLFPNKKKGGGGRDTFVKITNIQIKRTTAMGVSLMGEFYGNFGFWGGMFAFFIWGKLVYLVVFIINNSKKISPIYIFWLPIIFFQVIKAETDLTSVLNHLVKSIIFVGTFMYILLNLKKFKV